MPVRCFVLVLLLRLCPDVELMCDSFVDAEGGSLCPSGFSAIANGGSVSCGIGEECDEATCCDEGEYVG